MNIQKFSSFLKLLLSFVGLPLLVGSFVVKWFLPELIGAPEFVFGFRIRMLAAAVDSISFILLGIGCVYLIKILAWYSRGILFSDAVVALYTKISKIALLWALYNPIKYTLLWLVTTLSRPAGQRVLTIRFSTDDVVAIMIAGLFFMVTVIVQQARDLQEEHDLTI